MNQKPNVIMLMVDQLSEKWLQAALDGACDMPNMKRFISQGVRFNNMYSPNPVCCPTRATLATGLSTRGHGVIENGYALDPCLPTFMRSLQNDGYYTGILGKLHFKPHFEGFYPDYHQYGFDVTHVTEDGRGGEWLDWVRENYPEHFDNALATIWPSKIPEFGHYGKNDENYTERIESIRASFDWTYGGKYPENEEMAYILPFPKEVCQTEWITTHALNFLRSTTPEKPFFAQISYVQPHAPFSVAEEYMDKVDMSLVPETLPAEWKDDPNAPACFTNKAPEYDAKPYRRHCYFADLMHLDEKVGEILDCLEEIGQSENTYIVFLADHGELLGDHGFYGKEERHYDACLHVPLIITGPGVQKGVMANQMIQHEDICPTILEMAGLTLPAMPKLGAYLDMEPEDIPICFGHSVLDICAGNELKEPWRDEIYSESYNPIWSMDVRDWARTVRNEQYRYTCYPNKGGEQLFDMVKDPDELNNLAYDAAYAQVRQEMRDILMEKIILQDFPKTRRELYALGVH